jgi:membrane protein required for colicin V production
VNVVDFIILVVLALAMLGGFSQGFIVEIATIAGAVIALAIAKLEYGVVRNLLEQVVGHSRWVTAISYLVVFLVVWGAIIAIARVIRRIARLFLLGFADRLGGAVIGLLQGALVVELLLYLGNRVPSAELHRLIHHSRLAPSFLHIVPYIDKLFPHVV